MSIKQFFIQLCKCIKINNDVMTKNLNFKVKEIEDDYFNSRKEFINFFVRIIALTLFIMSIGQTILSSLTNKFNEYLPWVLA